MKLKLHQELTEEEIEAIAAKRPLPELDAETVEYFATELIKRHARGIAISTLAGERYPLKTKINREIKYEQRSKRFYDTVKTYSMQFDKARNRYLVFNPSGKGL